jgi:amino acid transporter, AAT family
VPPYPARNGMAPKSLAKLNNHAVPQNAGILTLLAIWTLLGLSYFFGQSMLYIALLLVSGFTGAIAWISLCWAQINFRRRLIKAGYTPDVLHYKTPGHPYTGIIAIALMIGCLFFLMFNHQLAYRIAFMIGFLAFVIPMLIYKLGGFANKRAQALETHQHTGFEKLFPKKLK